ncbi:MAG: PaaI family thioesterase [Bacteroidales bacterium]|jgi:uncharacterized protein (TIGR00369 family)|nr:PaaI family thioesterase [Bacteroidales bacterium]
MKNDSVNYFDIGPDTPVELINESLEGTLVSNLNIRIEKVTGSEICASMPLCEKTRRPGGIMHGGANIALAETIAGVGSQLLIDMYNYDARGVQVSANHVRGVSGGNVHAVAKIIHKGMSTHIWNVDIKDDDGRLISSVRVLNMIVKKK